MPITPLNRITTVDIDLKREVGKLAAYSGPVSIPNSALAEVYRTYRNMKTLKFFGLVEEKFNNKERLSEISGRTYDIFKADLGRGQIFVIIEASYEAANAFMDDGQIMFKLREWLTESLQRVVDARGDMKLTPPIEKWDRWLYGKGTALPRDVRAIPFYSQEFSPGTPALTLILVKPQ
ncbi:conserved hypothetical protein [Methanocella paludicola SANAE]|uniref:Uncharacterized protein n=1 Tax=Methanocella paludicola (strain DSM 17711 / JCM 13418 / NBRC 101707 / SANAE) TaxID=304371 RepID=D1YZI8_METPS|nr:hypothetical protein [Methanocella paludicola]BAI61860.1 conserved hypothetical protein [Methanocella paludicola SANAE]